MQASLRSFVILGSGHAVILDGRGHEIDVLPRRLTRPLVALVASATSSEARYEITPVYEEDQS